MDDDEIYSLGRDEAVEARMEVNDGLSITLDDQNSSGFDSLLILLTVFLHLSSIKKVTNSTGFEDLGPLPIACLLAWWLCCRRQTVLP